MNTDTKKLTEATPKKEAPPPQTDDEKIDAVAAKLLVLYREAFEELSK